MRMILTFLILLVSNGLCERDRPYINFKLVKIIAETSDMLNRILEKLHNVDDLRRDHVLNSAELAVSPDDIETVTSVVTEEKAVFEILHENLQESIDEEFRHFDMRRRKRQALRLEDAVKNFLTLKEMYEFQDRIVSSCKHLANVEKKTIGYSVENNPINVIKISRDGSKGDKKTIFIEAGIHAREWLSHAMANYMIYQLACNDDNTDMLDLFNWEILPVLNPDGYQYTHKGNRLWRKNRQSNGRSRCVGTDLNRNFETGFGRRGASRNQCSNTYRGRHAYSAPETKALRDYVRRINSNIASYLSIHTYGQYILLPWSYTATRTSDYASLMSLAKRAEAAMKLRFKIGSGYTTIYPAAGVSTDFTRDVAGIARSYTWELMPNSGAGLAGFTPKESLVPVYTPTIWRGIRAYAKGVADEIETSLEEQTSTAPIEKTSATKKVSRVVSWSSTNTKNVLSTGTPPVTRPAHINPSLWNVLQKYPDLLQEVVNNRSGTRFTKRS